MRSRKKFLAGGGAFLAFAALATISFFYFQNDRERVRFGYSNPELSALIFIADEKGFFDEHGIKPEFVNYQDAPATLNALRGGAIDFALSADFTIAVKSFDVPDLRVIARVGSSRRVELVMRADRGYRSIRDLRGKSIGIIPLTQADFELGHLLRQAEMTEDDVVVVHDSPSVIRDLMIDGTLDAAVIWDPFTWAIQQKLQNNVVTQPAHFFGGTQWLLATTDDYLQSKPSVALAVLRALREAEQFARENPESVLVILADRLYLSPEYMDSTFKKIDWAVTFDDGLRDILDYEIYWWGKYGLQSRIQTLPDANQLLFGSIVKNILRESL